MSGKCDTNFVASDVVAKCVECKRYFHPAYSRAGSTQNFTKGKHRSWKCDICVEETASVSSRSRVFELQNSQQNLEARCSDLEQINTKLNEVVLNLNNQPQDIEQHSRSANIEIVGLPSTHREDIYFCLQKVARTINVPFRKEDFSIAHRLRLFSKRHVHPPIIAQFISRKSGGGDCNAEASDYLVMVGGINFVTEESVQRLGPRLDALAEGMQGRVVLVETPYPYDLPQHNNLLRKQNEVFKEKCTKYKWAFLGINSLMDRSCYTLELEGKRCPQWCH
ncbi:hypothetical protein J6590_080030 [Homalodisca vitripennis]|nr:hypothetical protein J6590_080030 [Homalodisca vitripennis]